MAFGPGSLLGWISRVPGETGGMHPDRFSIAHTDFDAFAADAPGYDLRARQLDRGPFASELRVVRSPRVQLFLSRMSRGMELLGEQPPGMWGFAIPAHDDVAWSFMGMQAGGRDLICAPARDEVDMLSRPGWGAWVVNVAEEHLLAVQARLGLRMRLPTNALRVPLEPTALAVMRRLCGLVVQSPPGFDVLMTLEEDVPAALLRLLASGGETASPPEPGIVHAGRAELVVRAREHIRCVLHEAPTVAQIEGALGTSGRTLRRAFREHVGVSPKEYIHAQRLNGVRRALLLGEGNVTEMAGKYGFWHMGQFAADYRRQFGELPSETLRGRGRQRPYRPAPTSYIR